MELKQETTYRFKRRLAEVEKLLGKVVDKL